MLRDSRAKLQSSSLTTSFNDEAENTAKIGPARSACNISATSVHSSQLQVVVATASDQSCAQAQISPVIDASAISRTPCHHGAKQTNAGQTVSTPMAVSSVQGSSVHLTVSTGGTGGNQEDGGGVNVSSSGVSRRKDLLRVQKRAYRGEKKRALRELTDVFQDPSLVVLADWLKVRGALKSWTRFWCVVKPGILVLYKKSGPTARSSSPLPATGSDERERDQQWVGTVLLTCCEAIERPSKKDGFCFKLFHPLEQSIWATRGPKGEAFGAFTQPLPYSHLIFRASSNAAGRSWLDALELAVRCSHLLVRAMSHSRELTQSAAHNPASKGALGSTDESLSNAIFHSSLRNVSALLNENDDSELDPVASTMRRRVLLNESELEGHFRDSFEPAIAGTERRRQFCETDADADDDCELLDGDDELDHAAGALQRLHAPASDVAETDEETDSVCSAPARNHVDSTVKLLESSSTSSGASKHNGTPTPTLTPTTVSHSRNQARDTEFALCSDAMETKYIENGEEDLGRPGDVLTEDVNDENKSIIWSLLKQLRPGMDLSRVVLPTFILEPRSLLDKFTDFYSHADILSEACQQADAYSRMKMVVKWYLSGFYKKPRGLKKPYNPVVGESFRCSWQHPKTGSRTFYVAEQVSHHPPISAFHVSNRQDGFCVQATVITRSKFYGNSLSAILEASCRLTMLNRGEEYLLTMPYVHCKGILIGSLSMEYGGKVLIRCPCSGYETELEFKHKPLLSAADCANRVTGRIRLGGETLASVAGRWDRDVYISDVASGRRELLFNSTAEVRAARLKRCTVPLDEQLECESERLWLRCSEALRSGNMDEATRHKLTVEDRQRQTLRELKSRGCSFQPRHFELADSADGPNFYLYKYADLRAWDAAIDLVEFEADYVVQTKTRRAVPLTRRSRATSTSSEVQTAVSFRQLESTHEPSASHNNSRRTSKQTSAAKGRSPPKRLAHAHADKHHRRAKTGANRTRVTQDDCDGSRKRHLLVDEDSSHSSATNARDDEHDSECSSNDERGAVLSRVTAIRTDVDRLVSRIDSAESMLKRILEKLDRVTVTSENVRCVKSPAAFPVLSGRVMFAMCFFAVVLLAILFARLLADLR